MITSAALKTLLAPWVDIDPNIDFSIVDADYSADFDSALAHQHRRLRQTILAEMAKTQIILAPTGLRLIAPDCNCWEPDDMASQDFANMPAAFAQDYLTRRLRNFFYETFCCADEATPQAEYETQAPALINDRLGGGLHMGLLEQFMQSNHGTGFFDSGWTVLQTEADGAIAVTKDNIVVHVEQSDIKSGIGDRSLSLHPEVSIKLPGHRFESGAYIAIGNEGPVSDKTQAVEFYLAAFPPATPVVMTAITTALNGHKAVPYTLKVPYRPEDYKGPEAMVLRVAKDAIAQVLPLIEQIWQQHLAAQNHQQLPQLLTQLLRPELPVFAEALWPGISIASVIESDATQWFGSSADLSRTEQIAAALVHHFYAAS